MQVCRAVSYIQFMGENRIRLAVLSAEITSNPHFFDKGSVAGKLLEFGELFYEKDYGHTT
ncbi:TIGR02679 domain-containing protein [Anaerocolumna sp. AGMB13020]|uniref:TIGR02679 domain-containing protein n=1 Tax=Anaerocolumna sp. AGMB13020 TaxID=3081750 RepID=UPI003FA42838